MDIRKERKTKTENVRRGKRERSKEKRRGSEGGKRGRGEEATTFEFHQVYTPGKQTRQQRAATSGTFG
jgi:hypothetical protein